MFNEHGEFKVTPQNDILLAVVVGAWNAETANAYRDPILDIITPLKGNLWGLISNVNDLELCTPDCELLMGKLLAECRAQGLKREAVVNDNIKSVKMELFHKHANKNTLGSSSDVFLRCFLN
jgi:hypothetical protein